VIGGYLDALAEDEAMPPTWRGPIAEMQRQAERMTRILRDLIELSRLESSDRTDSDEVVDVPRMLELIVGEFQSLGGARPTVTLDLESDVSLLGNESELHSIFYNLVNNAVRFTPPAGTVKVAWREDDEGVVFESAAICLHLGDQHPESGLLPAPGTHDRALVYQWACFAPAELEPPLFEAWIQAERDPDRAAVGRQRFSKATSAVEAALDGAEYLVAGRFTVADVMVGTTLMFTARAGIADLLTPALTSYMGRLGQREGFQRAFKRAFG